MSAMNVTIILVFVVVFAILVSTPVRRNQNWSATVTPLASIIGSGFLVSVPLLASAVGIWSIAAVAGLALLSFLIGGAIRYNIGYGEPIFEQADAGHTIKSIETLSQMVLIGAYFISVAYYLVLLSAFALKLLGLNEPLLGKLLASVIVTGICAVGATKGLRSVENAEKFAVGANFAAIAALLVALAIFGIHPPPGYSWTAAAHQHHAVNWDTFRFVMGLLIIVQGFETTRFMGQTYSAKTRISAMRNAQISSSAVYVVFFILAIPLFPYFTSTTDVAGFIDVIGRVTPWLPYVVTAGAVASQFSASVADSIGASGLIAETTRKSINTNHAYLLIGAVSVLVIWTTNVVSVVALASRAFALFYALQCVVAALVASQRGERGKQTRFGLLAALSFAVAVMGIPAGG